MVRDISDMTGQQKAELAALAAMLDDDIDAIDIPGDLVRLYARYNYARSVFARPNLTMVSAMVLPLIGDVR